MRFAAITAVCGLFLGGVSALDKPLDINVVESSTCAKKEQTKIGDNIDMHYRGTLEDGTEFDASYNRGTPLSFKLGKGQVIKGWDEGLQDMCIGDKRRLTIQPEYGYGARGVGPIPGNAVLIFETELIAINGRSTNGGGSGDEL